MMGGLSGICISFGKIFMAYGVAEGMGGPA